MSTTGTLIGAGTFLCMVTGAIVLWEMSAPQGEPPAASVVRPDHRAPRIAESLGALAQPSDPHERKRLAAWLAQAGWPTKRAAAWFYASRAFSTVLAPIALWSQTSGLDPILRGVVLVSAGVLGFYLPLFGVLARRSARQERLRKSIANMLDMLVSCLESGLGIDAALQYVAGEIRIASTDLADELTLTNSELAAGVPRLDALRHLDERTGVEELTALTAVLGQADRYGAGVAPSIRAHAHLARRRRALLAEQRAARASPILTILMILFILPALFVVLLGPTMLMVGGQLSAGGGM
jgi:tight adherence protein C